MVNGLDVVAIRVDEKSGIIARMVAALAGRSIVLAAIGEPGLVEALDLRAVIGLEGEMDVAPRGRILTKAIDPQFVADEMMLILDDRSAKRLQDGAIKSLGRSKVACSEVDMVDQPATMNFHLGAPFASAAG